MIDWLMKGGAYSRPGSIYSTTWVDLFWASGGLPGKPPEPQNQKHTIVTNYSAQGGGVYGKPLEPVDSRRPRRPPGTLCDHLDSAPAKITWKMAC
jgi:hypothetical protein